MRLPTSAPLARRAVLGAAQFAALSSLLMPLRTPAIAPRAADEFAVTLDPGPPGFSVRDLVVAVGPTGRSTLGPTGGLRPDRDGTSRVLVSDVVAGGPAAKAGIETDAIIVAVGGVNVERESAAQVVERVQQLQDKGVALIVKDPYAFNDALNIPTKLEASSAVAPATASEPAQIIRVRKTPPDGGGGCTRQAQNGDLIEMSYEGRLADGTIFDGMELAKQRGDSTIQFVLGRQPGGQFPPSWDVGMVGMCVGERRTISVPPVLGFGKAGRPKRGVPPDAALVYDVELLGVNGLRY